MQRFAPFAISRDFFFIYKVLLRQALRMTLYTNITTAGTAKMLYQTRGDKYVLGKPFFPY